MIHDLHFILGTVDSATGDASPASLESQETTPSFVRDIGKSEDLNTFVSLPSRAHDCHGNREGAAGVLSFHFLKPPFKKNRYLGFAIALAVRYG